MKTTDLIKEMEEMKKRVEEDERADGTTLVDPYLFNLRDYKGNFYRASSMSGNSVFLKLHLEKGERENSIIQGDYHEMLDSLREVVAEKDPWILLEFDGKYHMIEGIGGGTGEVDGKPHGSVFLKFNTKEGMTAEELATYITRKMKKGEKK